jgi:hypothetical protein
MVYSHDVYGFAACSKVSRLCGSICLWYQWVSPIFSSPITNHNTIQPLASITAANPAPHAWRCRVTLSLTAPRAALSLSLGVIGGGLGQAAAAAFPAVGLSSNGAEGGCVHGQRCVRRRFLLCQSSLSSFSNKMMSDLKHAYMQTTQ